MTVDDARGAATAAPSGAGAGDGLAEFVAVRPRLFGIAYRMLGSVAEAEDVVQDAWLRWQSAERGAVRNPAAFLTTTTTRLAINAATSARAVRERYVGPWLPEPVDTSADPALGAERAEALDLAVLLLLERLTPTERAAYVLREAFDYSHQQVGEVLDTSEVNARQLVSRARRHLASQRSSPVSAARRRELVEAFLGAAREGDVAALERLLAEDVRAWSDGGGRVNAARRELAGVERVTTFLDNVLRKYWHTAGFRFVEVNGGGALLVTNADGSPQSLVALDCSDRGIERVLIVVNPDKLRGFAGDR